MHPDLLPTQTDPNQAAELFILISLGRWEQGVAGLGTDSALKPL